MEGCVYLEGVLVGAIISNVNREDVATPSIAFKFQSRYINKGYNFFQLVDCYMYTRWSKRHASICCAGRARVFCRDGDRMIEHAASYSPRDSSRNSRALPLSHLMDGRISRTCMQDTQRERINYHHCPCACTSYVTRRAVENRTKVGRHRPPTSISSPIVYVLMNS